MSENFHFETLTAFPQSRLNPPSLHYIDTVILSYFKMTTFVLDPATDIVASVPRINRQFQRRQYRDKQFKGGEGEWKKKIDQSATVYVGNLSCYTNEYQLYELFTRCGSVRRIIMGLDKIKKTPCGFCFVEFDDRDSALQSVKFLSRTHLDGREIQVDMDAGFEEGRQFGRGAHGGQIGDERRRERDQSGAGGYQQGPRGPTGSAPILTRSITVVACIALISILMLANQFDSVTSDQVIRPFGPTGNREFISPAYIRRAQLSENRMAFERSFARMLVGIMKNAKPSLLRAFIQETLNDKQLKEIAIGMFFNNTGTDEET